MKKKYILLLALLAVTAIPIVAESMVHYRHSTFILNINNKKILVDPIFAPKEFYPPIKMSENLKKNPLVDLDVNYQELMNVDGVIITHNHNDHFDIIAQESLPKSTPILCQSQDFKAINKMGFSNITSIDKSLNWLGVDIERFKGTHAEGLFKILLGYSSSYLLTTKNGSIFISGDTLLTTKQMNILSDKKPNIIIANGGGAMLKLIGKITMDNMDLLKISNLLPNSTIIAIHMDSINHCLDTSHLLKDLISNEYQNIIIPTNNEQIELFNE